jgi:hypothetical protein
MRRSIALLALAGASFTTQAGEVYGGIGLPGLMLGYAHAYSPSLTARVDVATLGSRSGNRTENGIAYAGKIEAHRAGVFGDWFPFAGGFRLTGGVTFNKVGLELGAQPGAGGTITIGPDTVGAGTAFPLAANDRFDVSVKFPSATPYVGIGYGHHQGKGLGFVFDLGVSIGRTKLDARVSGDNLPGYINQADIDAELAELRDGVGKVRVLPQLSIGLNYRF